MGQGGKWFLLTSLIITRRYAVSTVLLASQPLREESLRWAQLSPRTPHTPPPTLAAVQTGGPGGAFRGY